ncbi:hypothetical protein PV325_011817 [Microctonus aethiopoides]|uniref:OCIA domain-containing protein n=1 Tax=Microctonus aethiopoides TaxID=144406 RepID=A0AA39FX32_9HYME|nr:hypothetical protein PV325_011817 [Microctonus aethiopoides]KAK0094569.1 hypothetical protein PV326_010556 [Microctonus aethiopoides]KAK0177450.1 hypothetical protein PV328_001502 [Microctonus aethiopoides]
MNQSGPNYYGGRQMQTNPTSLDLAANGMNLQLTQDELRILKECQYNSMVLRGLPLGGVAATTFYYLMKSGTIKKNRFSLAISGITGFLIGTMSYRQICVEKLLALPNSSLKERILTAQGKQPHVRVDVQSQDAQSQSWFDNSSSTEQTPMTSSLDIEPYNQTHRFDDLPNLPLDAEAAYAINPPLQPSVGVPYTTYDDLRRNNREQYESARNYRTQERNDSMNRQSIDPRSPSYGGISSDPAPPFSSPEPRKSDFF